jgi:rSAM/selenodomain-associated transferase 1
MAKAPVAGRAKTRLASQIGTATALRFARQSLATVLARLANDRRWQTTIAVAPRSSLSSRLWQRHVRRVPQRLGDLGKRMQAIADEMPSGPVVIVGTDVPLLGAQHIARAFQLLGSHDAVFGPADDGGYWLVVQPFSNVRWSSPHALADTLLNLKGRSIAMLAKLADVDDAHAFAKHAAHCGRRIPPRVWC